MSSVALPVGLPPQTDDSYAYSKPVGPGVAGASGRTWTVDGGECWLFQSIYAEFFNNAADASFEAVVSSINDNGDKLWQVSASVTTLGGGIWGAGFTLGGASPVFHPVNEAGITGALPWLVLPPTAQVQMTFRPFGAGDTVGSIAQAYVTAWYFGAGSAPAPGSEPTGPYLYVPGPDAG